MGIKDILTSVEGDISSVVRSAELGIKDILTSVEGIRR